MILSKQQIVEIMERFKVQNPNPKSELDFKNPFTLLVSVVLSAQATDKSVNFYTKPLYEVADTPQKILALGQEKLIEFIKPIGLWKNKSKNIIALSKKLIEDFGGIVPDSREKLMSLPGVGRKSANLIMGDVFGEPAIVTDTHCIRLVNRMGLVDGIKEPKKVEMALWKIIPPEEGSDFCHRLVYHGREVCTARTKPYCDRCCLADICKKNGVEK